MVVGLFVLLMIVIDEVLVIENFMFGIKLSKMVLNKVVKMFNWVVVFNYKVFGLVISVLKFVIVFMFIKISNGKMFDLILIW